jgi:ATP-dependent Clp protease ATP-binding subunit ClpA
MFERFTTEARNVVVGANAEAQQLKHPYIGTEHLLLSMLRPASGPVRDVLVASGLDRAAACDIIARTPVRGADEPDNILGEEDAAALEAIGIDLDAIKAKIEESFGPGAFEPPPPAPRTGLFRRGKPLRVGGHLPFTFRAKKVLELSLREAIALHHKTIGAEHLMLGILREGRGMATIVLRDAGVDRTDLRQRIIAGLRQAA